MHRIAVKTLLADRGKLTTALAGVVFSVVLVNIQGGLFLGLIRKAALLVDHGQADIWIGHRHMHNVDFPRDIPRRWADRVRPLAGVKRAEPYLIGYSEMTLPDGGYEGVFVVGADRNTLLGSAWNLTSGSPSDLLRSEAIIVDDSEDGKLADPQLHELREIGGLRARVVGKSHGIAGFLVTPYVFTTFERAAAYIGKPAEGCSYILVQLQEGAQPSAVAAAIRRRLPEADVYTRDEYGAISVNFWMTRTGLGISFGAATLLGLIVGLVMVAQTLYAMVLDRLSEFGTLKAIGATEGQVCSILLVQALIMAIAGSLVGLLIVWAAQFIYNSPHSPIVIPWWLSSGSCLLVLVICLISSLLPYVRIRRVDPLIVLQS